MTSLKIKEGMVFLFLFLIVFGFNLFIFNGRFIYTQIKYSVLGAPSSVSENQVTGSEESDSGNTPQRLIIPSLSIDVPIVLPESSDESILQGALERGVVFWPDSASLEEKGTIVILGHSSAYPWYKGVYGSVFSLLNKLEENDEIFVFSAEKKYVYRVIGKEINLPENLNIEKQEEKSVLYLLSCWPINTNWKRITVKAVSIDKN